MQNKSSHCASDIHSRRLAFHLRPWLRLLLEDQTQTLNSSFSFCSTSTISWRNVALQDHDSKSAALKQSLWRAEGRLPLAGRVASIELLRPGLLEISCTGHENMSRSQSNAPLAIIPSNDPSWGRNASPRPPAGQTRPSDLVRMTNWHPRSRI